MPYPEEMVAPMRAELTRLGAKELRKASDVDAFMKAQKGTAMLVVNSVCGCAAGGARPAVSIALQGAVRPDQVVRSLAVYPTTVGLPVVPLEACRRASFSRGRANRPNG